MLEARVHRLEQDVEAVMQELELVSSMREGPDKQVCFVSCALSFPVINTFRVLFFCDEMGGLGSEQ